MVQSPNTTVLFFKLPPDGLLMTDRLTDHPLLWMKTIPPLVISIYLSKSLSMIILTLRRISSTLPRLRAPSTSVASWLLQNRRLPHHPPYSQKLRFPSFTLTQETVVESKNPTFYKTKESMFHASPHSST